MVVDPAMNAPMVPPLSSVTVPDPATDPNQRKLGIGGSDVAPIMGFSKWRSPLNVYLEKIDSPLYEPQPESEPMIWGRLLEPVVADEYARRTGAQVATMPLCISERYPFMRANVDRRVVTHPTREGSGGVECKTGGQWINAGEWGEHGSSDIPFPYKLQCQHYMAVLGWDWFDVPALIGGNDFRVFHIKRDPEAIDRIIDEESLFWDRVQMRDPPEPISAWDFTTFDADPDGVVDINTLDGAQREHVLASVTSYLNARDDAKAAEAKKLSAGNALRRVMKTATAIRDGNTLLATWRKQTSKDDKTTRVLRVKEIAS